MLVPFQDVQKQMAGLRAEVEEAVGRVLASGQFILGTEVAAFEEAFAASCEVEYCVGVDSGLSALELVLRAAGVGPGDEVITVSHTFIATVLAITSTGATPVLVEVQPETGLMDAAGVEAALTPRTKAIIPVHLYGQMVEMAPLLALAEQYHLFLLEDACQAHGARQQGRRAGSLGHAAAFSFYPAKNLGAAGDGGAVTTNDPNLAERVRQLRNYGQRAKYEHVVVGFNRRLDALQAAILRVKLRYLESWNAARRQVAQAYTARLAGLPVGLPQVLPGNEPVWHLYVIQAAQRDLLQQRLTEAGIATGLHYPVPVHQQAAYPELAHLRLPVTERLAAQGMSLPMFAELTPAQVEHVVQALTQATAGMQAPVGVSTRSAG